MLSASINLQICYIAGNFTLQSQPFNVNSLPIRLRILEAVQKLRDREVAHIAGLIEDRFTTSAENQEEAFSSHIPQFPGSHDSEWHEPAETIEFISPWRGNLLPAVEGKESGNGRTVWLGLEWVHGYGGNVAGGLHLNCAGEAILWAGRVAVVLNSESQTQRFFDGHAAAITCLALHSDGVTAASGEAGPAGAVLVWDTQSMELRAALRRDPDPEAGGGGGIACVCFAPDAARLLCVDVGGRLTVWDWRSRTPVGTACAGPADGASALAVAANPYGGPELRVATVGPAGVAFFAERRRRLAAAGSEAAGLDRIPADGPGGAGDGAATAVTFVAARTAATGSAAGAIVLWMEQGPAAAGHSDG